MGKRKGKVDPSINPELKGKRVRENGRLKRQHDDKHMDKIQDKLLIDAGVDEEMIKTISDVEKQAIVKAIVESNPELNLDAAQPSSSPSSSSGSKQSPGALSLNDDDETQPPDEIEICESPYSDAGLQLNNNLQSDQEDKETLPREDLEDESVCSSPLSHIEEDSNNNCPLDGDPTQQYEFVVSEPLSERHRRDSSPLGKRQNTSSILATETQFSPSCKENGNDLDPIPESPSSSCLDTEDEETVKPRENKIETTSFINNYQAKPRSASLNLLPRYSIDDASDPCLYSQVIKLMFDIYIRRLRSAQAQLKTVPTPWGNPVKRGNHCENILRREVVEYIDGENSNKRGRGRRLLRRKIDKESENVKDFCSNEGDDQEKTPAFRSRKSEAPSTSVGVSGDASTSLTVVIDDEKASDFTEAVGTITVHRGAEDSDKEISFNTVPASEHGRSVLINSNKRKKRKEERNIITKHPEHKEQNPLSPETATTMLSLKRRNVKEKLSKEEDGIEILDKDKVDNGSSGSWLSSENGKGKKRTNSKDRSIPKKKRPRSDSPIIEIEKNTNGVGERKIAGEQAKSKKMSPEEVLCVIDENSESGSLPDLLQDNEKEVLSGLNSKLDKGKEKAKSRIQKDITGESSRSIEKIGTDTIPISLDSSNIINLDSDLYGTQMTAKVDKTRRKMSRSITNDVSDQTQSSNSPAIVASCSYVKNKSLKKKEMEDFDFESEINERDSGFQYGKSSDDKKRNRKKKFVIDDDRQKARLTVDDVLFDHNSESEEDISVLKDPCKSVSRSIDEKGKGCGKGPGKKKKRKLFSEDTYEFTEIQPKQLDDARDTVDEGVRHMFRESERVGKMKSSDKRRSHRGVSSEDNNMSQASTNQRAEENVDQSMCPICGKVFPLTEIEAHASSCGEGIEEDDQGQGMTGCMICHKEVDRESLKRHQNLCATAQKDQQALPAKRVTRGKRDAPLKKQIFAKEKSPSSSGEDFGELVIEVDDRSR